MSAIRPGHAVASPSDEAAWSARSARLFRELRGPAAGMIRRAYGRTFDEHAMEDVYAAAWLGTYRALATRHAGLDDDEIRRYLLTAVARQASKELRRRRRRPVAPLESAGSVSNGEATPDERADQREQATITRDLLASLPRRRRAVLMLRYGWGLEPSQVCELIKGLSPRAYRKEITRGVDDLTDRIRTLERGEWCADREPILKAFAAGLADEEQSRQARRHLAHCRRCARFVARLSGHLHDAGVVAALSGGAVADGELGLGARLAQFADWGRDLLTPSGAPRGAAPGAASALAKLAGMGAAGNASLACLGGAAILCVAGGVGDAPEPASAGGEAAVRAGGRKVEIRMPVGARAASAVPGAARGGAPVADAGGKAPGVRVASVTRGEADPHLPAFTATHTRRNYETRWFGAEPTREPAADPLEAPAMAGEATIVVEATPMAEDGAFVGDAADV